MPDPAMTLTAPGIALSLDADAVRGIVREVVREALQEIGTDGRLAYSEAEAADLLGLRRHQLRDCRLRGEISAARCGKEIRYARREILRFLDHQTQTGNGRAK